MNKIIMAAVCLSLAGCASLKYPNWESVKEAGTAYKQPCKQVGADGCHYGECELESSWFKKRATTFGANNFIIEYAEDNGLLKGAKYYYCGPGIPPYMQKSGIAWTVRNKINPAATEADLSQVATECGYEAHKATIDTSRKAPDRIFIPTTNFNYNMAVLSAQSSDRLDDMIHDSKLSGERAALYSECLAAKGYVYKKSTEKNDLAEVDKYCPDIDTVTKACFIPGALQ
ncbi:MAG: hypothetical protein Q8L79_03230 [Methylobacter sp.]|uniref:hypothetical protein n=1 Tax=Methylobacter sp. TaxID=2051955 RepID=UPI0027318107|nr:hypothetical protein [Methylobacter sp.]MDP1664114.1 hypothetical protein [Methylobacter sp.]